jgi:hypothetical protein
MQVRNIFVAVLALSAFLTLGRAVGIAATSTPIEATDDKAAADAPSKMAATSAAMTARVDDLLAQMWAAANIEPAATASDSEFLRRAYLDLVGVIPRASETREFLADQRPNKRSVVIDRLLASPRHSTHMATLVRNRILPLGVDPTHDREALGLQKWLRTRFAKNLRYDNLVGGLLLTSGGDELGPALYFRANNLAPEKMAGSAAELFLGLKLQCAECHDHPFAHWKQKDFWGVAAFFARVKDPDARQMQRNAFRLVDADSGDVMIPDSTEKVPPKYLGGDAPEDDRWQSRRSQFATWMASSDNPWFSRAAVNWTWSALFGQNLVDSLDDVGTAGAASLGDREKLLDELATYFVASGFDLRNLWRTLANTRAYQLSGQYDIKDAVGPDQFAYKLPRPLTPEQCYDSFMVLVPRDAAGQEWSRMATSIDEDPLRMEFVRTMRPPPGSATEYRGSTLQSLAMMNGPVMGGLTSAQTNRLIATLDAPFMTDKDRADAMYLAILSREPRSNERDTIVEMLSACNSLEEKQQAQSDLLWALLNSTEFAFNR